MPNKKSAEKELRKNVKRQANNKKVSDHAKKLIKTTLKQVEAKDVKAKAEVRLTIKAIDKLAKKGVIKKNTASRKKSQLQKKVNSL
jgi:small subunit ribosomal protein S20